MDRVGWAVKRAWTIARYEGFHVLLWRLLVRALAPVVRIGVSRVYLIALETSQPAEDRDGVVVGPLQPGDLDSVVMMMVGREVRGGRSDETRAEKTRQAVLERLAAGHECFVARDGREVVHCSWVTFCWIEWPGEHWTALPAEPQRLVLLSQEEAFHSDAYTHESWRGRGIYRAALGAMQCHLRKRGITRLYAEVALDNRSSSKTHQRLGWQRLGTVFHARPAGTRRAARWALGGQDPFVSEPGGYLRFRSTDKPAGRAVGVTAPEGTASGGGTVG